MISTTTVNLAQSSNSITETRRGWKLRGNDQSRSSVIVARTHILPTIYTMLASNFRAMQGGVLSQGGDSDDFVEVWARNIDQAFIKIRNIIQEYPYVAMVRVTGGRLKNTYMSQFV